MQLYKIMSYIFLSLLCCILTTMDKSSQTCSISQQNTRIRGDKWNSRIPQRPWKIFSPSYQWSSRPYYEVNSRTRGILAFCTAGEIYIRHIPRSHSLHFYTVTQQLNDKWSCSLRSVQEIITLDEKHQFKKTHWSEWPAKYINIILPRIWIKNYTSKDILVIKTRIYNLPS